MVAAIGEDARQAAGDYARDAREAGQSRSFAAEGMGVDEGGGDWNVLATGDYTGWALRRAVGNEASGMESCSPGLEAGRRRSWLAAAGGGMGAVSDGSWRRLACSRSSGLPMMCL